MSYWGTISPVSDFLVQVEGNSAAGAQQAFLVCSLLSCSTDAIDHHGGDEVVRARLALPRWIVRFAMRQQSPFKNGLKKREVKILIVPQSSHNGERIFCQKSLLSPTNLG
jgi:hypothetical protein